MQYNQNSYLDTPSDTTLAANRVVLFNKLSLLSQQTENKLKNGIQPSKYHKLTTLNQCYASALTAIIKLSKKGENNGLGL